jgi:hypothetical protein
MKKLLTSLIPAALVFATVVYIVGTRGNPWQLGWLRIDEAVTIAEDFLVHQGADLSGYTTVKAVERRQQGNWGTRPEDEWTFGVDPAVGYLVRFFRENHLDGWTVGVAPTGQIYRVERQQLEDEPGARLDQDDALDLALHKLSGELRIPTAGLYIDSDTLIQQPQRSDWTFNFAWPDTFGRSGDVSILLSGTAITGLSFHTDSTAALAPPARQPNEQRQLGFILIILGVFIAVQRHRTRLALGAAAIWSGVIFCLVIFVRALTFPQAMILIPPDSSYAGFFARVALGIVVAALQSAITVGLVVATGEALWRDMLPRVASLTHVGRGSASWGRTYGGMIQRSLRWGLWAAAAILLIEATLTRLWGPVGLTSKIPDIVAGVLSSPAPSFAISSLIGLDMLWDEGLFRLWLIPLWMLLMRAPLAIVLSALAATYFAGYDSAQFFSAGALLFILWGLVAGFVAIRVGVYGAMLFHFFALGAHSALVMIWTGFGQVVGATFLAVLFLITVAIYLLPGEATAELNINDG